MRVNPCRRGGAAAAALAAALMLLPAGPSRAEGEDRAPVMNRQVRMADAKVFQSGVDLTPKVRYRKAILTVSGPSGVFRRDIDGGQPIEVGMMDPEGEVLLDGVYRWELRLVPDEATAKKLRAMARAGRSTADVWPAEAGEFAVIGGVIDTSQETEPRPTRVVDPEANGRLLKSVGLDRPTKPRVSTDGDDSVEAGRVEPTGIAAKALTDGDSVRREPRSAQSAAARAAAGDNDDSVTEGGVAEKAAAAQEAPDSRRRKYNTPDSQGRSKSGKKDQD